MIPSDDFQVRNEAAERALKEIGDLLRTAMPPGFGFSLLIFNLGPGPGAMFYTSNAERQTMIEAMREFIAKFEGN